MIMKQPKQPGGKNMAKIDLKKELYDFYQASASAIQIVEPPCSS